jgi:hypothetical protein
VPLPEFAGSAFAVVPVEDEPDLVIVFVVEAAVPCEWTRGAVASAWAASTPTAANAAIVITSTEKVEPRPGFGRPAEACRSAERGGGGGGTEPCGPPPADVGAAARDGGAGAARRDDPAALVPLPMGAIMPYRNRTG